MHAISMPQPKVTIRFLLTLIVSLLLLASIALPARQAPVSDARLGLPDMSDLAISFVPNRGQLASPYLWQARARGGVVSFERDAVSMQFASDSGVRLAWEGANAGTAIAAGARTEGVVNYIRGNDPSQWLSGIPTHSSLTYTDLYPGISLKYDGVNGVLKGTYTVAAGANPALIRWRYEGASRAQVDAVTGNLRVTLPNGRSFVEEAPVAWQTIDGARVPVSARFSAANGAISFAFPDGFDRAHMLVIDPVLVYSSYFGGISTDTVEDVAVDGAGNLYVTGSTYSNNLGGFPNTPEGSDDLFAAKLNTAGTAWQWVTYLGGTDGESGYGVAVSGQGTVWVTGYTDSDDFPTTANAHQSDFGGFSDVLLSRLNGSNGTLNYSTYFGMDNLDEGRDITLDSSGNVYIAGQIHQQHVLALKFTGGTNPSLVYDAVWGDDRGHDIGYGIAVDSAGRAYIAGMTENAADPWGSTFPLVDPIQPECGPYNSTPANCSQDAFISILNATGTGLDYSTLLGGGGSNGETSGSDTAYDIALDSSGNIYVTGMTYAYDFPTHNAAYPNYPDDPQFSDAWLTKLSPDGQAFRYSTYLGGESSDEARALATDSNGNAYIIGFTRSDEFPVLNPIQSEIGMGGICYSGSTVRRCYDAFIAKFSATGPLAWSTYLGGDYDEYGYGIARDGSGNLYVGGETDSLTFPTTNGAPQTQWAGNEDGFVAKISEQAAPPPATVTPTQPGNPPTATPTTVPPFPARKTYLPLVRG